MALKHINSALEEVRYSKKIWWSQARLPNLIPRQIFQPYGTLYQTWSTWVGSYCHCDCQHRLTTWSVIFHIFQLGRNFRTRIDRLLVLVHIMGQLGTRLTSTLREYDDISNSEQTVVAIDIRLKEDAIRGSSRLNTTFSLLYICS